MLQSIKCAETDLPPTPTGNLNHRASVATNLIETRLGAFAGENFEACKPLCTPNSSTVTPQGPGGLQAETGSGQPSKHPYGHGHVEKEKSVSPSSALQVQWTEGPKDLSLVRLFNVEEELVIRTCCGKTHRHTTMKKHENLITRSTMQAPWCARENHDRSHSSAGFVTVLLQAMVSLVFDSLCHRTHNPFHTVVVFSV